MSKKDIKELKLENALNEERKRKDYLESQVNRQKDIIAELEEKLRKTKVVESKIESCLQNLLYS